jgi:hypothetical protein
MPNRFITKVHTSLDSALPVMQDINGYMMVGDSEANEIVIRIFKNGEQVVLDPSPSVNLIRAYVLIDEGSNIIEASDCSINDQGEACVVIPSSAYEEPGVIKIFVRLFSNPASVSNGVGTGWRIKATIARLRCVVQGYN